MKICRTCGFVLTGEARCQAEELIIELNPGDRHNGYCWGGRIPTSEDLEFEPIDKQAARARGAFKYRQLKMFDE